MEAKRKMPNSTLQTPPFLDKQQIAPQPKTILDSIFAPEYRRGMNRGRLQSQPSFSGHTHTYEIALVDIE